MHFQIICVIRLKQPLVVIEDSRNKKAKTKPSNTSGYSVALGVNANSILEAVAFAHDVAINALDSNQPKVIEELEAKRIDKSDWQPDVLKGARSIDSKGVYFVSSLSFFSDD